VKNPEFAIKAITGALTQKDANAPGLGEFLAQGTVHGAAGAVTDTGGGGEDVSATEFDFGGGGGGSDFTG
jgi:hypothetical protein